MTPADAALPLQVAMMNEQMGIDGEGASRSTALGEGVITPRGVNISSPALRNEAGLGERAKKSGTLAIP